MTSGAEDDDALANFLTFCSTRPLFFVKHAFTWGKGELIDHQGPRGWQIDILQGVQDGGLDPDTAFRVAVEFAAGRGHGAGASCMVAWLTLWRVYTCQDSCVVMTDDGDAQCTKVWAHLSKWARLCLGSHKFALTATFAGPNEQEPAMVVFEANRDFPSDGDIGHT